MNNMLVMLVILSIANAQSDGNPHNWDRKRRCDLFDYEPKCGLCEGVGGIPTGDNNDEITLTPCTPVANASDIDPTKLKKPVWANTWYNPEYYSVLIGKKQDPFCFKTFPGNDSVGPLCYVPQVGPQAYDMINAKSLRYDVAVTTKLGTLQSLVLHNGPNLWIVNKFPWYAFGTHQCICTIPGGSAVGKQIYPLQFNWTENLHYLGKERIDIEYIDLANKEMDHWIFGPHHIWTVPEDGTILRMWQPFNGLQVFGGHGANPSYVDPSNFTDMPPALCKKGGATFRIGCQDNGMPQPKIEEKFGKIFTKKDLSRAHNPIPGHDFRGTTFFETSNILNKVLKASGVNTKECSKWSAKEIQGLQMFLYSVRNEDFNKIYSDKYDPREIKTTNWDEHNKVVENTDLHHVHRDGHCHEAVMWFIHHLTASMKKEIIEQSIYIPLLAYERHDCPSGATSDEKKVYGAYKEQVTCADCHSNVLPQ